MRGFRRILLAVPAVWVVACATGEAPISITTMTTTGGGGTGGGDLGPCGQDCAKVETAPCTISVCNTGQVVGPLNTCVVVPAPNGSSCDDGKFCTINDVCQEGACVGGEPNRCGLGGNPCVAVLCYEEAQSCDVTPANDGTACTPTDLCQVDGVCQIGVCVGKPKDCTFSPLNECNTVACEPATGKCVPTPDLKKDDAACVLSGDPCMINRTCKTGVCGGGTPKDCSAFDVACQIGVCDSSTGNCGQQPAPVGSACTDGIAECHVGSCDAKGACVPKTAADGIACNDHNGCTKSDTCLGGICSGSAIAGCSLYYQEGFETCPHGWTFGGDWQCGTPSNVGPPSAHTGSGVIATQIAAVYSVNQNFAVATADSPAIDLTTSTNPMLSFWVWDHTEGGTFDGWNLKISTDDGMSYLPVTKVSPAYDLTIANQAAWGGDHSAEGWRNFVADLSDYAGKSVRLRYAFRSDAATVYAGVYLDDLVIAEPPQTPLYIATTSPLADIYEGMDYAFPVIKTGGSSASVWSIVNGGTNDGWLTIDPATGVLKGAPKAANVGPVSVVVHVEEPSLPSNYAEKKLTFNVLHDAYYTSFEGMCPAGWTLTGDWQCGVPTSVGPATAFIGTQCLATQITGPYHALQTFAGTTATSPDIDLTGVSNPTLTFRMWIDTEGSTYDGVALDISTDGGATYSTLTGVTPAYPLMIGGKPAWGGHQAALGWQLIKADLSNFAGMTIRLRFSFQSDSSGNYPGVYIDDLFID